MYCLFQIMWNTTHISMRVVLPNLLDTFLYNVNHVKMIKYQYFIQTCILYLTYVYYWWWDVQKRTDMKQIAHYLTMGWSLRCACWVNKVKEVKKWQHKLFKYWYTYHILYIRMHLFKYMCPIVVFTAAQFTI